MTVASGAHRGARIDFDDLQSERGYHAVPRLLADQARQPAVHVRARPPRRRRRAGLRSVAAHPGSRARTCPGGRRAWRKAAVIASAACACSGRATRTARSRRCTPRPCPTCRAARTSGPNGLFEGARAPEARVGVQGRARRGGRAAAVGGLGGAHRRAVPRDRAVQSGDGAARRRPRRRSRPPAPVVARPERLPRGLGRPAPAARPVPVGLAHPQVRGHRQAARADDRARGRARALRSSTS